MANFQSGFPWVDEIFHRVSHRGFRTRISGKRVFRGGRVFQRGEVFREAGFLSGFQVAGFLWVAKFREDEVFGWARFQGEVCHRSFRWRFHGGSFAWLRVSSFSKVAGFQEAAGFREGVGFLDEEIRGQATGGRFIKVRFPSWLSYHVILSGFPSGVDEDFRETGFRGGG